jgi:hypothetical protein
VRPALNGLCSIMYSDNNHMGSSEGDSGIRGRGSVGSPKLPARRFK